MDTKKLRQKILDLAIRGKLVPQDPNDEPASVLLDRIRAEKERLIAEGKIKRSKKSKTSDASHYQKLPNGWTCAHLSEIVTFGGGKTPSTAEKRFWQNGQYLWVTSKDMKNEIISDSKLKLSTDGIQELSLYSPGTILMVVRSGILRRTLPIAILKNAATINQDLKAIIPLIAKMSDYIYWFIKANEYYILENYQKDGTTVESINFEKFQDIEIPIPPLSEQNRIIYQLKKWMQFIDNIEHCKEALSTDIIKTKSIIINLAISGKLVPQDPNDESVIEALRRINPSFQPCDNPQYEQLPKSWAVAKIGDVYTINPRNSADDKTEAGFVPMTNIHDGYNNSFSFELRNWGAIKTGFTHFRNGDIVVAKISPCLENRKSAVISGLPNGIGAGTTELHVFRQENINPLYGLMFFKTNNFIQSCTSSFNGAVGQQRVSTKVITDLEIPIPPIAEQQRIVDKVNELFTILDGIQNSLDAN
jgi:type I restriction enzyme S subunit